MKVLFVCLGNICRSPLAEAVFNDKIQKKGWQHLFQSDSCGTSNYNVGDDPDPRAFKTAAKNSVHMQHKARQIKLKDYENSDLILAMDESNFHYMLGHAPSSHLHKLKLLREYDPNGKGDVPDPYYGTEEDFDQAYEFIYRSIDGLIKTFEQKVTANS